MREDRNPGPDKGQHGVLTTQPARGEPLLALSRASLQRRRVARKVRLVEVQPRDTVRGRRLFAEQRG